MIHPLSDVKCKTIPSSTNVWQFCVILSDAVIGNNCNINAHVFIENDVVIGNNVTIKSGVQLWDGITIEDNVFIGPNVTFSNEKIVSRSKKYPVKFDNIIIKKGASIGLNASIIAGNEIGEFAMIGAGSVVTKNVGKNELWVGNPARKVGYVSNEGDILNLDLFSKKTGLSYKWFEGTLKIKDD
jgi:UDP-2-acetamido-3-amino-2,3-dideoxy-glucuronate N-acetyltransferase